MSNKHYIIPIFVPHEGCPHNCVFCNQSSITGSTSKVNSFYVRNTIEDYLKTLPKHGATIEVSFFGGTFTAISIEKQKELLEVAREYKLLNKINFIRLSTRPDYIDTDILDNLKEYSVDIIELGVQSMDSDVLIKSGRGHNEQDVILASELIKKYGFTLGHQVMLGLPGDTFDKDVETTKKLITLKPSMVRIYPSLVIKDTPMEKMYTMGTYEPYSLIEAVEISKKLYGMFVSGNINVIRIGLQPTEEINVGKEIVAGPFHPSFRELVEGSLIKDMILEKLPNKLKTTIHIYVNPKDVSKLYSNKKMFFNDIINAVPLANIMVVQKTSVERGSFILEYEDKVINMSINKFLVTS